MNNDIQKFGDTRWQDQADFEIQPGGATKLELLNSLRWLHGEIDNGKLMFRLRELSLCIIDCLAYLIELDEQQ